ncbi:MAG: pilus assembly PilX N-terminal domain-containing protein [Candidatus Moranbacteria bacterium]|jgi:hypothetical protein|nr:pilus assembly PilX N-terminal domain-containing protein [Candidatus Moranbacteria bacterium]
MFKENSKKGSALVYILIIMSAVMIILTSMIQFVVAQLKYSQYEARREESLQIAEAGIYFYRWYLAHEVEGKTAYQVDDFWQNQNPLGVDSPYEQDYKDPQGGVIGRYSVEVTPPDPNSTIVVVQSTGWTIKDAGSPRTVRVRFRRPSWSEYLVLSNASVRFGDGTETFGLLHSNGGIRFDGIAHNIVSSSQETYVDPDTGITRPGVWTAWTDEYNTNMGGDVFQAGTEFPVAEEDFNGVSADLALMKSAANSGINGSIYFGHSGQGQHIILKDNGTFDSRTVSQYDSFTNVIKTYAGGWSTHNIPNNGVIFVENNVWLEGKIDNKRVTVAAADIIGGGGASVYIGNDIRYTNYDGSDILGIIGQNDVEIIKDSENDLQIDGALIAQTGRVGRDYYSGYYRSGNGGDKGWKFSSGNTYQWGNGAGWYLCLCEDPLCVDHKDSITLFGAMATNDRYGFAYTDSCPRDSGYTDRNLIYDNNLLYYPPPYFPTSPEYSLDMWDEL